MEQKEEETQTEQLNDNMNEQKSTWNSMDKIAGLLDIVVPQKYKAKAMKLLQFLNAQPGFKINEKGQVIINDKLIPNAHIVDWIRYVVIRNVKTLPPEEIDVFYSYLKEIHAPVVLFSDKKSASHDVAKVESIKPDEIIKGASVKNQVGYGERTEKHLYVKKPINELFASKDNIKKKWKKFKF